MNAAHAVAAPSLAEVRRTATVLSAFLNTTPCTTLRRREAKELLGIDAEVVFKLERARFSR